MRVKNKIAPPFRQAEFDIIFGKGICKTGNILDVAVSLDIVNKAGSWFSYNDEKLGQGRDKSKEFLEANPEVVLCGSWYKIMGSDSIIQLPENHNALKLELLSHIVVYGNNTV